MKLKISFLLFAICVSNTIFAQLSTRENTTSVFRTGSRPQAGTYGVFIGPSLMEIQDMSDENIDVRGLPLINIKYYKSDNIEWRFGLQFNGKSSKQSGTELSTSTDIASIDKSSYNRISVGLAYHYSPKNLLDVYTGVYIPLGWDRYKYESTYGKISSTTSKFSPIVGLGAYIGLQAFVADLPISVGFEYGLRAVTHMWQKYKHVDVEQNGKSQTYYTTSENDRGGTQYSSLNYSKSDFGTDARITFSYYFNK